jgi:hypothetical protein
LRPERHCRPVLGDVLADSRVQIQAPYRATGGVEIESGRQMLRVGLHGAGVGQAERRREGVFEFNAKGGIKALDVTTTGVA